MVKEVAPVQPIATLREEDGFVLGIRRSRLITTEFEAHVVCRADDGRIVDTEHDSIEGNTGAPIFAWMPLPFTNEEVEDAILAGEAIGQPDLPVLEGDPKDHLHFACQVADELAEAIGPRRAMLKLHAVLGDDVDGLPLPSLAPAKLFAVRDVLTGWVHNQTVTDANAINLIRKIFD